MENMVINLILLLVRRYIFQLCRKKGENIPFDDILKYVYKCMYMYDILEGEKCQELYITKRNCLIGNAFTACYTCMYVISISILSSCLFNLLLGYCER